ncbi:hypothetical protein BB559_005244, partial [Furculomyces boomerangus]
YEYEEEEEDSNEIEETCLDDSKQNKELLKNNTDVYCGKDGTVWNKSSLKKSKTRTVKIIKGKVSVTTNKNQRRMV